MQVGDVFQSTKIAMHCTRVNSENKTYACLVAGSLSKSLCILRVKLN